MNSLCLKLWQGEFIKLIWFLGKRKFKSQMFNLDELFPKSSTKLKIETLAYLTSSLILMALDQSTEVSNPKLYSVNATRRTYKLQFPSHTLRYSRLFLAKV
jgi:hypothetical protein